MTPKSDPETCPENKHKHVDSVENATVSATEITRLITVLTYAWLID